MANKCLNPQCQNTVYGFAYTCDACVIVGSGKPAQPTRRAADSMAEKYPKYYKAVPAGVECIDVYAVCAMFPVQDDTGCINHARKKLLVPGTRTGGKSFHDDIKEARDTLTRWLELNPE